jgi:hypothetical protein
MKTAKWLVMMSVFASLSAFAQAGNGAGNGGGEDGNFKNIRDDIQSWMEKNVQTGELSAKLKLSFDQGDFYAKFVAVTAAVGEKITFNHEPILFSNNVRVCKNDPVAHQIQCNIDEWSAVRGDSRYMIVLHEYLGIAGIESNQGDSSTYPVSKNILPFVYATQKWELGMAAAKREGFNNLDCIGRQKNFSRSFLLFTVNVESDSVVLARAHSDRNNKNVIDEVLSERKIWGSVKSQIDQGSSYIDFGNMMLTNVGSGKAREFWITGIVKAENSSGSLSITPYFTKYASTLDEDAISFSCITNGI